MTSILEFKANLNGGGARPNQFRVNLTFPTFVSGGSAAARKGQFLCNTASLPGSHVNITPVYYRGRQVKLAGEREIQNWQIQIINDTDFAIHDAFESWSNYINNVKTNNGLTNPLSYTVDMNIEQLDRNGSTVKTYRLADCWPVSVGEIPLAFGNNDVIEEFPVEIAYSFFETTNTATSVSASVGIATPFGSIGVSL